MTRTLAVWSEFGDVLDGILGFRPSVRFDAWRPGDQRIYVSDIRKAARQLRWQPRVSIDEGVRRLVAWVKASGVPQVAEAGAGVASA